ncbi:MAG: pyruvate kinase [Gemmatimonadales bacterium]|nr:pyruvate kinase [Gemmatimonadales bacterium]
MADERTAGLGEGPRRIKIVATLGPSWAEPGAIARMLEVGVDVVRINTSHGTPEIRSRWIGMLREVITARAAERSAAILVDLQGPRIRVGTLPAPRHLEVSQKIVFAPEAIAGPEEIPTTYDGLAADVRPGARILLDDGLLAADVLDVDGPRVLARVVHGGELKSNKGMNLPGVEVSAPAVSDRDREEVRRAVELGVEYIAVSFVRRPHDVEEVRRLVPPTVRLIAKIEKDTALREIGGILNAADAIMVARGDLGVELPFEDVPLVQKRLIREASAHGKPVITATQMLESMVHAPRPTRAEASDVANAILDGTDAVMLSAETAVGKHPMEAVQAMVRIARKLERERPRNVASLELAAGRRPLRGHAGPGAPEGARMEDALAVAVCAAAELMRVPCITCFTSTGFTARTIAAYRPSVPIIAFTPDPLTHRQLALVWGVLPVLVPDFPSYDELLAVARQELIARGLAKPGERVVVSAGVPFGRKATTNLLKVESV